MNNSSFDSTSTNEIQNLKGKIKDLLHEENEFTEKYDELIAQSKGTEKEVTFFQILVGTLILIVVPVYTHTVVGIIVLAALIYYAYARNSLSRYHREEALHFDRRASENRAKIRSILKVISASDLCLIRESLPSELLDRLKDIIQ